MLDTNEVPVRVDGMVTVVAVVVEVVKRRLTFGAVRCTWSTAGRGPMATCCAAASVTPSAHGEHTVGTREHTVSNRPAHS